MSRPTSAAGRLARFGFADTQTASGLLGEPPAGLGLWNDAEQRPVDADSGEILGALAASADPDLALRQLHRVAEYAQRSPGGPDPMAAMRADADLRTRLAAVLGSSTALGDDIAANPGRWLALGGTFDDTDPLGGATPDSPASLRSAYRSALLRIAAADLTHTADVEETMSRLSLLADATLRAAMGLAESERGARPRLAVIAMGKCGGRELNYVSDVDGIFVAARDEDLDDGQAVGENR